MLESEPVQTKKSAIGYNYYCPYSVLTMSIPHGDVRGKKTPLHYPYIENIKASLHLVSGNSASLPALLGLYIH